MPRIGITLGDINGIGTEVALKAARALSRERKGIRVILVGSTSAIASQARKLKLPLPEIWDPAPELGPRWKPGAIDASASRAADTWIRAAVDACLTGTLDAMVTGPISKSGFHAAGIDVPGHTELIAGLTGTRRFAMMLFGGPLKVSLVTRHVPYRNVPRILTKTIIEDAIRITAEALPWMGCKQSNIAVCGLNPHAGEGGDLGTEEIDTIAPAVRAMKRRYPGVQGPLPADTVFHKAVRGDYQAVIAMYHDQGLAPLKMLAFDTGVNVTLGLPIVRTSPDHGTAFDIAGRGVANPSSMIEAVRWAARLAGQRNPWSGKRE
jgi:4-hydroxythreonine-4-phosphate dehydrogenase